MGMELLKVFMSAFWDKHWLIYFCISKKTEVVANVPNLFMQNYGVFGFVCVAECMESRVSSSVYTCTNGRYMHQKKR